jgi:hypothetical protein
LTKGLVFDMLGARPKPGYPIILRLAFY